MECGSELRVKDIYGANKFRFIAQCHGRFLVISHSLDYARNGNMLPDWGGVLRELVAVTVPAKMIEHQCTAEGIDERGLYVGFPLTYPLSVSGLAALLHTSTDNIAGHLADLAVEVTT